MSHSLLNVATQHQSFAANRQPCTVNPRPRPLPLQGEVPPVPGSEEDEFMALLKQQTSLLHHFQQQRGLVTVRLWCPRASSQRIKGLHQAGENTTVS